MFPGIELDENPGVSDVGRVQCVAADDPILDPTAHGRHGLVEFDDEVEGVILIGVVAPDSSGELMRETFETVVGDAGDARLPGLRGK